VVNHPVLRDDGLLAVFLAEPSFEDWRKHSSISLEEESVGKRIDRTEEMAIPSDLEEKLAFVRGKVPILIDQWQKVCIFGERIVKRREAAAASVFPRSWSSSNALILGGYRKDD
jgi:sorting nexin-8